MATMKDFAGLKVLSGKLKEQEQARKAFRSAKSFSPAIAYRAQSSRLSR